jgi:hypothetical protein
MDGQYGPSVEFLFCKYKSHEFKPQYCQKEKRKQNYQTISILEAWFSRHQDFKMV